jgi:LPS O-antigen subunit length determinant protein (WzzB/FepE family)
MSNNYIIDENGINILRLTKKIWKDKFKVFLSIVFSLLITLAFQNFQTRNFTATTEIKTISSSERDTFITLENLINSINLNIISDISASKQKFNFSRDFFLNLFKEVLNERDVFEKAIHKFNLLDLKNYSNEKEYKEAITKLTNSVKITTVLGKKNSDLETKNFIKFLHDNETKWNLILADVNESANRIVRQNLRKKIDIIISIATENKKFEINAISTKIKNLINDYDRQTSDRIAYLREQADIANQLGITKNNLEVQTFVTGTGNTQQPFVRPSSQYYLRGYEAIEKEIELIQQRTDKKAFIGGLFNLEKIKRDLEQEKFIDRIKYHYELSPLGKEKNFTAANINVGNTKYLYKNFYKIIILSIILGTIIGIIYILIPIKKFIK